MLESGEQPLPCNYGSTIITEKGKRIRYCDGKKKDEVACNNLWKVAQFEGRVCVPDRVRKQEETIKKALRQSDKIKDMIKVTPNGRELYNSFINATIALSNINDPQLQSMVQKKVDVILQSERKELQDEKKRYEKARDDAGKMYEKHQKFIETNRKKLNKIAQYEADDKRLRETLNHEASKRKQAEDNLAMTEENYARKVIELDKDYNQRLTAQGNQYNADITNLNTQYNADIANLNTDKLILTNNLEKANNKFETACEENRQLQNSIRHLTEDIPLTEKERQELESLKSERRYLIEEHDNLRKKVKELELKLESNNEAIPVKNDEIYEPANRLEALVSLRRNIQKGLQEAWERSQS